MLRELFSTNATSFVSITTSAKSRCRTCCISALRTRFSSRCGTATSSRACRSRWPRDFGVAGRGRFYEEAGAIRDVVQNHMLQVVAFLAMEPPVSGDRESMRDEKVKVLRAMRPLSGRSLVRGQFDGYRDEAGVARRFPRRNVCGDAAAHRLLALERRAVLHPRRKMPAGYAQPK